MTVDLKKTVVVKLGGSILNQKDMTVCDLVELQESRQSVVLVHGGASMVNQWLADQGIKSQFYQGERITDKKALDVVIAVLAGLANKETVAAILAAGGKALGLSGVDGALIQSCVRDRSLGYLGTVTRVNLAPLQIILDAGFMPVISPVSLHSEGLMDGDPLLLNVNGDTVAGELAAAIGGGKLIFLTDVDGIHDASGKRVARLTTKTAREFLNSGVATGGMIPKLKACLKAAEFGVECYITDGRRPHALLEEISGRHFGTIISVEKSNELD
jgi:acetylglutamate kinase